LKKKDDRKYNRVIPLWEEEPGVLRMGGNKERRSGGGERVIPIMDSEKEKDFAVTWKKQGAKALHFKEAMELGERRSNLFQNMTSSRGKMAAWTMNGGLLESRNRRPLKETKGKSPPSTKN